ncbi:hypothetical protein KFE19_08135 [Dysosmobacter sp. Marseille-Q4140]|nr:hypothetical protein KFE19_08135 [Dysosmobacter sp. Marseille-Q4140]
MEKYVTGWEDDAMGWPLSLCGFALFFLSDYNDWRWGYRALRFCFPSGGLLLTAGTLLDLRWEQSLARGWFRAAVLLLGVMFLALLVYTLFFALPAAASYARPGEKRRACTTGVYALCRHPGVLWFAGVYGCLWLAAGLPLWEAALLCGVNVGLVLFEDRCVFPALLEGYEAYQAATPFLLPGRRRGRSCRKKS